MKQFFKMLFVIFIFLNLFACGLGGTDTGNPGYTDNGGGTNNGSDGGSNNTGNNTGNDTGNDYGPPSAAAASTSIQELVTSICEKLVSCNTSLTQPVCETGVYAQNNIDTEIGLAAGAYESVFDIYTDENDGQIVSDDMALANCLDAIDNLSCASASVTLAYTEGAPANFDNVYRLIPVNSCNQVY